MKRKPRICFACSAGGHFPELRIAVDELIKSGEYDFYWLNDYNKSLDNVLKGMKRRKLYNASKGKLSWVINTIQSLWYLMIDRPDVIISTGAGVAFPTMFFGKKLLGSKIIFVCSAANVTHPSKVPVQAYKIADLYLVQWTELLDIFPNAKYIGVL